MNRDIFMTPKYKEMKQMGYFIPWTNQRAQDIVFKAFTMPSSPYTKIAHAFRDRYSFNEPTQRVLMSFAYTLDNMQQFKHTLDNGLISSHAMASNLFLARYNMFLTDTKLDYIAPSDKYLSRWLDIISLELLDDARLLRLN